VDQAVRREAGDACDCDGHDIKGFHAGSERHGEIDIAARDMEFESVGNKGDPDQHKESERQHLVVGCLAMKAPTGPAAKYITIIAMTTAAIITSKSSAMPIA
jgi:hypothetical protein